MHLLACLIALGLTPESGAAQPAAARAGGATVEVENASPTESEEASDFDTRMERVIATSVTLRTEGRTAEALRVLQHAYDKHPHVRLLARIALAEASLDRWSLAYEHLRTSLQVTDDWINSERSTLEGELRSWSKHVALIKFEVTPGNAQVRINGVTFSTTGMPIAFDAGTVGVEVTAPGHRPRVLTLRAVEASQSTEAVHLMPLQVSLGLDSVRAPPADPWVPISIAALVAGGAGVATWVATAVAALATCPEPHCESPKRVGQYQTLKTISTVAVYSFPAFTLGGLYAFTQRRAESGNSEKLRVSAGPQSVILEGHF